MGVSSPDFHFMAIHTNAGFRNDYYPLLDAQNDWQKKCVLELLLKRTALQTIF